MGQSIAGKGKSALLFTYGRAPGLFPRKLVLVQLCLAAEGI